MIEVIWTMLAFALVGCMIYVIGAYLRFKDEEKQRKWLAEMEKRRIARVRLGQKYAVFFLVLSLGACASARPNSKDPWHVGAVGAAVADVGTTYAAVSKPGVVEANPVLNVCGDSAGAVAACATALKVGTLSLMAYLDNTYDLGDWTRRIMWLMPITLWGGAAIWNAQFVWTP